MGHSSSKPINEAAMQQIIERFNYLDENHDGNITLAELEEYHRQFDPNMDMEEVTKEFSRLDVDGNGQIRLSEYLLANGIDVNKSAAELEVARRAELQREARNLARGVTAVEILPDGSEAAEINVRAEARDTFYVADADVVQATVAGTNAYDDDVPCTVVAEAVSFEPDIRAP